MRRNAGSGKSHEAVIVPDRSIAAANRESPAGDVVSFCSIVSTRNSSMPAPTVYDFSARDIEGTERSLADYRGKVLLFVNVASECGFTPQYAGLEALQRKYAARGFAVLGFPCNQFGAQEPATEGEIRQFCASR